MRNDRSNPETEFINSSNCKRILVLSTGRTLDSQGIFKLVALPIADICQQTANEEVSEDKCYPIQDISSHSTLQGFETNEPGPLDYGTEMGSIVFDGKERGEAISQEQQLSTVLKTSLIDQLDELLQDDPSETSILQREKLELFECIQACSQESDQQDGDLGSGSLVLVKTKEVVRRELSPAHFSVIQQPKTQLLPAKILDISREGSISADLPSNKRHIIRNFFKPKRQHQNSMKDDKTSCNSRMLLEQMEELRSSQGLQSTGAIIKQRVLGRK